MLMLPSVATTDAMVDRDWWFPPGMLQPIADASGELRADTLAMAGPGLELHSLRRSFGGLLAVDGLSFSVAVTLVMTAAFYIALIIANGNPNGALAQIAAFVPPLAPMVVPARMVLGDMSVVGLVLAVVVDLLATAGLIALAASIYERAILRIGAPVSLRRLFA